MQALIDYDGWRKWKDSKDLTTTLSPVNKPLKGNKKSLHGKGTTSKSNVVASGKGKVKGRALSSAGKAVNKVNAKPATFSNADGAGDNVDDDDDGGDENARAGRNELMDESGVPVFSSIPDGVDDLVSETDDGDDEADGDDGPGR